MLLTNILFSLLVICSLREVACYSDYSYVHSSDYSSSLGPDSGFDRYYPHIDRGSGSDLD